MFTKVANDSLVENLMRECGLDVKDSSGKRIVAHALRFQIPFLEHLESEGVISFGSEDIDPHDGKKETTVPAASVMDKKSYEPKKYADVHVESDHQGDIHGDSNTSEGETSVRMKKEAQAHDIDEQMRKEVPVSIPGIKLKYIMKTDIPTIETRYKVKIKLFPSSAKPEGFEIVCSSSAGLQTAERRIKEAISPVADLEIKSIPFKEKTSSGEKHALKNSLQKMEQENSMVFCFSEDGSALMLMGEVEDCVAKLENQFGNVLELPEEYHSGEGSAKSKRGARMLDTTAVDSFPKRASTIASDVDVVCEAELFTYMRKKNPSFLTDMETKYDVDIAEDDTGEYVEITVSGESKKTVEVKLRELIDKFKIKMAKEEKSSGSSTKAPQDHDDKPPIPSRSRKPSSSSSSDDTPLPPSKSSASPMSASGVPLKTFRSKASKSRVHVFAYDITKLKVDVIVNAANEGLMHGAGVAWAIQKAAGHKFEEESKAYVRRHGRIKVTDLAVTSGGKMQCKAVFHAVGPNMGDYYGNKQKCFGDLAKTVKNCLEKTENLKYESIAIPAISSGKQM